jgi:hypothetical protein
MISLASIRVRVKNASQFQEVGRPYTGHLGVGFISAAAWPWYVKPRGTHRIPSRACRESLRVATWVRAKGDIVEAI